MIYAYIHSIWQGMVTTPDKFRRILSIPYVYTSCRLQRRGRQTDTDILDTEGRLATKRQELPRQPPPV